MYGLQIVSPSGALLTGFVVAGIDDPGPGVTAGEVITGNGGGPAGTTGDVEASEGKGGGFGIDEGPGDGPDPAPLDVDEGGGGGGVALGGGTAFEDDSLGSISCF